MQSPGTENNNPLQRRREPRQKRSQKRINEILEVTARLLARVGLDDLTTVLIARELGISVGSVYHYFPNKFAILYAVGERWLEEMTIVLGTVESWDLDKTGIEGFVDQYCDEMLKTYRVQIAVLPMVQAMVTMPELRKLDELYSEKIISCLMKICRRLGIRKKVDELNRIGCLVLEISHTLFMVIAGQNERHGSKTLTDLKGILKEYMRQQMA
jgi:AcrR family transcriptional regulator